MFLIVILIIFGLVVMALIIGELYLSTRFSNEVKLLFADSKNLSHTKFSNDQLTGLPEPVQRYFNLVLNEGQPYVSYVRITHGGQFKTGAGKPWVSIKGEQYATTEKPGFIWKGRTRMFTARDMYIADKGRLVVSLFSLVKVVDGRGADFDQGEISRWLAESVLYPTNLLPGERLQWSPIDSLSASFIFTYNKIALSYIVTFNEIGEITQLETKRFMDKEKLETWIIKLADYQQLNGIIVPTRFEVLWRLKEGDLSYARFNINRIEYNNPIRFSTLKF